MKNEEKNVGLGILEKLGASVFYGSMGLWSVLLAGTFGAFSQAWMRALIVVLIMGTIGILGRQFKRIQKSDWKWFLLIAIGSLNIVPYFLGFKYLGAGGGTVVFNVMMAVSSFLMGRLFFKEKITPLKIASLLIASAGILMIYGFKVRQEIIFGSAMMLLAGGMTAMTQVFPKKLVDDYSQTQVVFTAFSAILLVSLPLAFLLNESLPTINFSLPWIVLFVYALVNISSMYLNVTSLKHLDVTLISLLALSEIIFGVLFGVIFLQEKFSGLAYVGILMIIVGLGLEAIVKIAMKKIDKLNT